MRKKSGTYTITDWSLEISL